MTRIAVAQSSAAERSDASADAMRMTQRSMQIDVSFLPALAAAFMLIFARIGTMVMLLPGLGEMTVPARVRLTIALVLTAVLLPLHRAAYHDRPARRSARCC